MRFDVLLYIIVTMVSICYAIPWLSEGKAAFVSAEGKFAHMRLMVVFAITAAYVVLNNATNFITPYLGSMTALHFQSMLTAVVFYTALNSALDALALAICVRMIACVFKDTWQSTAIRKVSVASVSIVVVTTLMQNALALEIMGLN